MCRTANLLATNILLLSDITNGALYFRRPDKGNIKIGKILKREEIRVDHYDYRLEQIEEGKKTTGGISKMFNKTIKELINDELDTIGLQIYQLKGQITNWTKELIDLEKQKLDLEIEKDELLKILEE